MRGPIDLIGPSYRDDTLPLSAQERINLIPEIVEAAGGANMAALKGAPGATQRWNIGDGPIRGSIVVAGRAFVVSGLSLYELFENYTSTLIGTIAGTGRVSAQANFTPSGDGTSVTRRQIIFVNGTEGYIFDTSTSLLTKIASANFKGGYTVAFKDQRFVLDIPNGEGMSWSGLASGTSYGALDYAIAETKTDKVLAVATDHNDLFVFGEKGVERYTASSDPNEVFDLDEGFSIERGLAARFSVAQGDNTLFWVADNRQIVRMAGAVPERISTQPIEQELAALTSAQLADLFGFFFYERGHAMYALTNPAGKTYVYDVATKLWHRRKTHGLDRWRANTYFEAFGKRFIGDYATGKVFELRHDVYRDGDLPLVAENYTRYFNNNGQEVTQNMLELVFDTGSALLTGSTEETQPLVEIRYSDDGSRSWSAFRQRSLGLIGQYRKKIRMWRMGQFSTRLFHIRISDPVKRDFIAAFGDFE